MIKVKEAYQVDLTQNLHCHCPGWSPTVGLNTIYKLNVRNEIQKEIKQMTLKSLNTKVWVCSFWSFSFTHAIYFRFKLQGLLGLRKKLIVHCKVFLGFTSIVKRESWSTSAGKPNQLYEWPGLWLAKRGLEGWPNLNGA